MQRRSASVGTRPILAHWIGEAPDPRNRALREALQQGFLTPLLSLRENGESTESITCITGPQEAGRKNERRFTGALRNACKWGFCRPNRPCKDACAGGPRRRRRLCSAIQRRGGFRHGGKAAQVPFDVPEDGRTRLLARPEGARRAGNRVRGREGAAQTQRP